MNTIIFIITIHAPVGTEYLYEKTSPIIKHIIDKIADKMTGVLVNGREVALNTPLKNNDRVQVITQGKIHHENWEQFATTSIAKQKIKALEESE